MNNCPAILLCQLAIRLLRLVKIVVPLLFAESVFSIPISAPKPVFGLEEACAPARRSLDEGGDRVQRDISMWGPRAPPACR